MKKMFFMLLGALVFTFVIASCDSNEHYKPTKELKSSLLELYPDARFIEWEYKYGYIIADCDINGMDADVWFVENTWEWVLTEFDLRYNQVPDVVKQTLTSSQYANWHIDDIDLIERPNTQTVYVFEVELGEQEMDITIAEDGTLISAVFDSNDNPVLP